MTPDQFMAEARRHLARIVSERGGVLYSAFSTVTPGRFYVLGLNPGGALGSGDTIAHCLDGLPQYEGNAYLDEDWGSDSRHYGCGGHPLQRHLLLLMQELGEDLRRVCAANLIFTRSPDQYGADYPERGHLCWPVHQMILSIVKPEVIIAFGNGAISPYSFLTLKHHEMFGVWPTEFTHPASFRTWQCKTFSTRIDGLNLLVLGLPHLSRYTTEGRPAVVNWIRRKISEHNNGTEPIR